MRSVRYEVKIFRGEGGGVNIDVEADGEPVRSLWIEGGADLGLPPVELVEIFHAPEVELQEVNG